MKFKKFAHLDVHRNVGRLEIPWCLFHATTLLHFLYAFFFKVLCLWGTCSLDRHRGADRNLRGHALLCQRELELEWEGGMEGSAGRFAGRWGAALRQAKLNLHPTLYACLHSPAMHSAGGRQNLSPSSGNYSELVRHVWYPGMHLSFIRCIYIQDSRVEDRKIEKYS